MASQIAGAAESAVSIIDAQIDRLSGSLEAVVRMRVPLASALSQVYRPPPAGQRRPIHASSG
jgi:hypothetical protein